MSAVKEKLSALKEKSPNFIPMNIRRIISALLLALCLLPVQAQEKGKLIDSRDGTTYETVKIGDQWWMAQNLAYLPSVTPVFTDQGIYVYDYKGFDVSAAKKTQEYITYGCLYNWKLANTVCPDGWHLPSDDEWKQMEKFLGMSSAEADSVNWRLSGRVDNKLMSTTGWGDNQRGNNESGFSALPGGISFTGGNIYMKDTVSALIRETVQFWTSTRVDDKKAWTRGVYIKTSGLGRAGFPVANGHSVRCVKNKV